jgi:tRNA(Arg) A34 adenosine deaminase TadA
MKLFEQARRASKFSDHRQHRVGAAVFYKGEFLAAGFNSYKTHPSTFRFPSAFTRHAEIHALLRAKVKKFDLTNATVVVYRETLNGELGMARPCEMCMAKAVELGIREVYYTTNENTYERLKL